MADFDPMTLIREQLAEGVAAHMAPPTQALAISPWVAMSLLQKVIRRGHEAWALNAAATLLHLSPDRLWRRLGIIAVEDIGLGDLTTAGHVTAALAGKSYRAKLGGDWQVASYLVTVMANSPKCRAADDLLFVAGTHPAYSTARLELAGLPHRDLLALMTGTAPLITRAISLLYALGTDRRHSPHLVPRLGDPTALFNHLITAGVSPSLVCVAQESYRKTGEHLGPLAVLLSRESGWQSAATNNDVTPPELMIGPAPSWCFDMFVRQGRATLVRFLGTDAKVAEWLATHVAPARRLETLGMALFYIEGGLLHHRLRWPVGDGLHRMAAVECLGCPDATELLALLRADLPRLNDLRQQLCGGDRHAH